jgi:hypothetical protein
LTGRTANLNAALATLAYRDDLNFSGVDTLSLTAGAGAISAQATVVSIAQQASNLQDPVTALQRAGC